MIIRSDNYKVEINPFKREIRVTESVDNSQKFWAAVLVVSNRTLLRFLTEEEMEQVFLCVNLWQADQILRLPVGNVSWFAKLNCTTIVSFLSTAEETERAICALERVHMKMNNGLLEFDKKIVNVGPACLQVHEKTEAKKEINRRIKL